MEIICVPEKIKYLWKELTESHLTDGKPAKDFTLSPYWEYHKNLIDVIELKRSNRQGYSNFKIKGDSGYYIPPKRLGSRYLREKYGRITGQLSMALKALFPRFQKEPVTLPYARALQLVLDKETLNCMPMHYDYFPKHFGTWTKRYPNNHVLLDWYIYSLICKFCNPPKGMSVLEIGAGNGNLASLISNYSKPETITIVDLAETLQLSLLYLGSIFTEKIFSLQHADPELEKGKADFNFLTPSQIDSIPSASIDLAINCHSFQEMSPETIERYFLLVRRVMRPGGIFIVINRVEKSPSPDEKINSVDDVVVRLSTYPWESDAIDLYYQISHMHKLIQNDPVQIRVQRYA